MLDYLLPLKTIFSLYLVGLLVLIYRNSNWQNSFPYCDIDIGNLSYAEITSHITVILIVIKLLFSGSSETDLLLGVFLCFCASFLVGTIVGKTSSNSSESSRIVYEEKTPLLGSFKGLLSSRLGSDSGRSLEGEGIDTDTPVFMFNGTDMDGIVKKG